MSSGVGRGRGWLNLGNQNTKNVPGVEELSTHLAVKQQSVPNVNSNDKYNSDASEDFSVLVNIIKQLSVNDDGIMFNQKIKYIIERWSADCENSVEVEKSFEAIHKLCLTDGDFATKVVLLIASRTFLSQEIHEKKIRLMFVRKLQDNYENCVQMQSSNPTAFRNSLQMMGAFFSKARLAGGNHFSFMATPLISYFEMLLESGQLEDLKLFAMQFYLNGAPLKSICPEKISEILVKIRQILCSDKTVSKDCKLWLLLSIEVANNRFALLPTDTNGFYLEQLGDQAMAYFQGSHGALTVQTVQENKTLDCYQSNVNVLQVSTPEQPCDSLVNNSSDNGSVSYSGGISSDASQNSGKNIPCIKGGKTGRPILGAGARLNKNRNQTDSGSNGNWSRTKSMNDADGGWKKNSQTESEQTGVNNWYKSKPQTDQNNDTNWREKENKKGNQSTLKTASADWEKRKAPPKASSKGWEHDDRFETDYS